MNICTPTNWITHMKWINSYKDTKLIREVGIADRPITSKEIEFFSKQTQNLQQRQAQNHRWLHD